MTAEEKLTELPEEVRVWLNSLLDLPDKEVKIQIATYLVEHNPKLMESLRKATKY